MRVVVGGAIWIGVLVWLGLTGPAWGRTWRVERGGGGDFTTLQPALDAAAAGDTILIGIGYYTEYETVWLPGWPFPTDIYAQVRCDDLTLIGMGAGTVIGPWTAHFVNFSPSGFHMWPGVSGVRYRRLTLRNVYGGIYGDGEADVDRCSFQGCDIGVMCYAPVSVSRCVFVDCRDGVATHGASDVQVQEGSFYNCRIGVSINNSSTGAEVAQCYFEGGRLGVHVTEYSDCLVRDCTMRNQVVAGLTGEWFALITAERNTIAGCGSRSISLGAQCRLFGSGNVVGAGADVTMLLSHSFTDFHGNHILKGGGPVVWLMDYVHPPPDIVDLTWNYWGTDSGDSLAAWIIDGHDDPSIHGYVQYEPFSGSPLSERRQTLGAVKDMFRGR